MSHKTNKQISTIVMFLWLRLGRRDKSHNVLAILTAEMYFRGSWHRTLEYVTWIIFWHLKLQRIRTLSLGVAQIQLRNWVKLGYLDSMKPNISNIQTISKIENNYNACEDYLNMRLALNEANPIELSAAYSGRARKYHVSIINLALDTIRSIGVK